MYYYARFTNALVPHETKTDGVYQVIFIVFWVPNLVNSPSFFGLARNLGEKNLTN